MDIQLEIATAEAWAATCAARSKEAALEAAAARAAYKDIKVGSRRATHEQRLEARSRNAVASAHAGDMARAERDAIATLLRIRGRAAADAAAAAPPSVPAVHADPLAQFVELLREHGHRVLTWLPSGEPAGGCWRLEPLVGLIDFAAFRAIGLGRDLWPDERLAILAQEQIALAHGFAVLERPPAMVECAGLDRWVSRG